MKDITTDLKKKNNVRTLNLYLILMRKKQFFEILNLKVKFFISDTNEKIRGKLGSN